MLTSDVAGLLMLFTVLSILPLLLVHEASGLRFLGNKPFFMLTSVSSPLLPSDIIDTGVAPRCTFRLPRMGPLLARMEHREAVLRQGVCRRTPRVSEHDV